MKPASLGFESTPLDSHRAVVEVLKWKRGKVENAKLRDPSRTVPLIQGKQVLLRGLERADLKVLHEMMNDEEVMSWARSKPDNTVSMEELEKEYEGELRGDFARKRTFIIVQRATKRAIGWATIRWWRPFQTTADIGIALAVKELRGKGIGAEVNMLLTRLAFEQYNLHKVELWTRGDNPAAIRSAEKNGYKIEGRTKETVYFDGKYHDGILMGLLRDDYEKSKPKPKA